VALVSFRFYIIVRTFCQKCLSFIMYLFFFDCLFFNDLVRTSKRMLYPTRAFRSNQERMGGKDFFSPTSQIAELLQDVAVNSGTFSVAASWVETGSKSEYRVTTLHS
jgi:hypothetical protein